MATGEKTCRTVLLSDEPASKDEFGSQSHQRLANALANLIRTEKGGKSIALEGSWGSGKSTVIKLLTDQFSEDSDTVILTFDAWAHQGDPLRRTFLETLIDKLKGKQWVDEQYWQGKQEELARRWKVSHKTSIPELKPLGVAIAIGAFFVPIGLALFSSALRDGLALTWSGWNGISLKAVVGLILAINPFLMCGLCYLRWRIRRASGRTSETLDEACGWNAILVQKHPVRERTETIETPDPTSVEFEHTFMELMDEALSVDNRRIVLVLDNLDRVDASDALSILATLQTFLQDSHSRTREWFKRLWVLIPYAPKGIERLWQLKTGEGQLETGKEIGERGSDENAPARRFIEKRFQVRFRVPPLVLSDWHKYLDNLLVEAFPDHDTAQFHPTCRVYDILRRDKEPPTPRDLKLFVNQIGTIHRQWDDTFPLQQIAYYVLLRQEDRDVVKELREGRLPGENVVNILGEGVIDNLAAMAFNTDVRTARQLTFEASLTGALEEGDGQRLKELAQLVPVGLWDVMERISVKFPDWIPGESSNLANAARALRDSELVSSPRDAAMNAVTNGLVQAVRKVEQWSSFDSVITEGIVAVLHFEPDSPLARHLLSTITSREVLSTHEDLETLASEPTTKTISSWTDGLVVFLQGIDSLGLDEILEEGVNVRGGAQVYVAVCGCLAERDASGQFWSLLRSEAKPDDIEATLEKITREGKLRRFHVNALRVLNASVADITYQRLVDTMAQRLRVTDPIELELIPLLTAMWELRKVDRVALTVDQRFSKLGSQGFILNQLHHAQKSGDYEACAWCVFVYLQRYPDARLPEAGAPNAHAGHNFLINQLFGNPQKHTALTGQFVDMLEKQNESGLLFQVLDANPSVQPWIQECIREIVNRGFGPRFLPSETFIKRRQFIKSTLDGETYLNMVQSLIQQTGLLDYLQSEDSSPEQSDLYLDILRAGGRRDSAFKSWCKEGLRSADRQTWQSALHRGSALVDLLTEFDPAKDRLRLPLDYLDALEWHAKEVVKGNVSRAGIDRSWEKLPRFLETDHRKMLCQRLLDVAKEAKGDIPGAFFDLYGEEIVDLDILRSDGRLVSDFFTPIVQKGNARALQWLVDVLSESPSFLQDYDPQYAVKEFEDRVLDKLRVEQEGEARTQLEKIAKTLGLQPKPGQEENGENE